MRRTVAMMASGALLAALGGCIAGQSALTPPGPSAVTSSRSSSPTPLPRDANILFWTQDQRDAAFRAMETLVPANTVNAGPRVRPLPVGPALPLSIGAADSAQAIDDYMTDQRLAGLIIVHNGRVRFERYGLGFSAEGRWTSFSVAKSFTSTLVGAAIRDGLIGSMADPITRYIPELGGSGYDGVSIAQVMSMQSGVRWNEDYADPQSDVARFNAQLPEGAVDPVTAYMRRLPRAHEPGTQWNYNTGETNLIGVLVERATGKSVSQYLTEKVWRPYGMEADAAWLLNSGGKEISGCCLSMRLRDYARFGQFVLGGGRAGGRQVVPDGWFAAAGRRQADIGRPGYGYGYQWWTSDDGSFAAQGIFGQGIFLDPSRNLVIAGVGDWPTAVTPNLAAQRQLFYQGVQRAIDAEAARRRL